MLPSMHRLAQILPLHKATHSTSCRIRILIMNGKIQDREARFRRS